MGRLLKPEDVAERLHVSRKTALLRMKQEMRCINVGNGNERPRWAVDERDFERWQESQKVVPALVNARPAATGRSGKALMRVLPSAGPIPYRKTEPRKKAAR